MKILGIIVYIKLSAKMVNDNDTFSGLTTTYTLGKQLKLC